MSATPQGPDRVAVLYDQDCGVCTATARFLRRWDRHDRLELIGFDEARRRGLAKELSNDRFYTSFHAIVHGRVLSGAEAIPAVLDRLPIGSVASRGIRRSRLLKALVRRAYEFVVRNRFRFAGGCARPSPASRESS